MTALQDHACGRLGIVTIEDVDEAARELGEFGRAQLAEKVGLRPTAVGRFLSRLIELGAVECVDAASYRVTAVRPFAGPMPSEAPEPPAESEEPELVSPEQVRDAAVALGRFTLPELCAYLDADRDRCRDLLNGLCRRGIIRDTGKVWNRQRLYDYVPLTRDSAKRRRFHKTPEQMAAERFAAEVGVRGIPIAGASGAPQPSQDKEVNLLVAAAWATGWPVQKRSNHYVVVPPGADRPIPVPSTPKGAGMVRAFRDQLVRAGLALSGFGVARGQAVAGTGRDAQNVQSVRMRKTLPGTRKPTRRGKAA